MIGSRRVYTTWRNPFYQMDAYRFYRSDYQYLFKIDRHMTRGHKRRFYQHHGTASSSYSADLMIENALKNLSSILLPTRDESLQCEALLFSPLHIRPLQIWIPCNLRLSRTHIICTVHAKPQISHAIAQFQISNETDTLCQDDWSYFTNTCLKIFPASSQKFYTANQIRTFCKNRNATGLGAYLFAIKIPEYDGVKIILEIQRYLLHYDRTIYTAKFHSFMKAFLNHINLNFIVFSSEVPTDPYSSGIYVLQKYVEASDTWDVNPLLDIQGKVYIEHVNYIVCEHYPYVQRKSIK